jgi:NAD(P)-dependent dehydrogenase (short-subunit alcohol dehydrogenase family)
MNAAVTDKSCVLVTAGAAGIGLVIAERFLEAGARVAVCDVIPATLDSALSSHQDLIGVVADIGVPNDVDRLFEMLRAEMPRLDVLVNNAGIGGPRCPVDETSDEEWDETIRVNLSGAFYCSKRAARIMKQQRSGCIINISTTSARTGLPNRSAYVASKVGLQGLTYNLARELGPYNIRCNAILPGPIDNERGRVLLQKLAERRGVTVEEALERRLSFVSMRTRIQPREIAEMAFVLASDVGRHVSGQMISVCGNAEWEE